MTGYQLLNGVLQQGLQLFVLVGLVYVVNETLARRRPKLAYVLWMLVFVKAITPSIGATGFSAWNLLSTATGQSSLATASAGDEDLQSAAHLPNAPNVSVSALGVSAVSTNEPWPRVSLPASLAVVWGIGVIGLTFFSVCATRRMSRRIAETAVESNGDLSQLVDELADTMSLVCKPECVVLNASIGPALRGFSQPQLLVPQRVLETSSAEELRLILLHELMHVRRRDVLAAYFQSLVQILWWFHPAVWFAGRMTSLERERCCDDAVLDASPSAGSVLRTMFVDRGTSRRTSAMGTVGCRAVRHDNYASPHTSHHGRSSTADSKLGGLLCGRVVCCGCTARSASSCSGHGGNDSANISRVTGADRQAIRFRSEASCNDLGGKHGPRSVEGQPAALDGRRIEAHRYRGKGIASRSWQHGNRTVEAGLRNSPTGLRS